MFLLVWRYVVRADKRDAFIEAYGEKGTWARFFARRPGHVRTELWQDPEDAAAFLTPDVWESADAFAAYQKAHHAEYLSIDASCEGLTEAEVFAGAFQLEGTDTAAYHRNSGRGRKAANPD